MEANKAFDFAKEAENILMGHAAIARAGIEAGKREGELAKRHLRLIVETAEKYPEAMLPTPLLCAILAAKEVL